MVCVAPPTSRCTSTRSVVSRRKHYASHDAFLEAFPGNFDAIFAGTKIRRVVFAGGRSNHMSGGVGCGVYDRDRRIRHRGVRWIEYRAGNVASVGLRVTEAEGSQKSQREFRCHSSYLDMEASHVRHPITSVWGGQG